jgi:hypothetical protein
VPACPSYEGGFVEFKTMLNIPFVFTLKKFKNNFTDRPAYLDVCMEKSMASHECLKTFKVL